MRTLYLHIGTGKTGTTTIQDSLAANRDQLLKAGYFYPDLNGERNHVPLALFASAAELDDLFRVWIGSSAEMAKNKFRDELPGQLNQELSRHPDKHAIFSSEHLTAHLRDEEAISKLHGLLNPHFQAMKVVVYLRRQDDILLSLYSTHVKAGRTQLPDDLMKSPPYWFDYWRLLQMWANIFGRDNLVVRLFERDRFKNGKLEDDFLAAIGIDQVDGFEYLELKNFSLDRVRLEFLRRFNAYVPRIAGEGVNPVRNNLTKILEQHASKSSLSYDSSTMAGFFSQFEDANCRVAAEYFGMKGSLFAPPKLAGSEHRQLELTTDQAISIAAELWIDRQGAVADLERRLKRLRQKFDSLSRSDSKR